MFCDVVVKGFGSVNRGYCFVKGGATCSVTNGDSSVLGCCSHTKIFVMYQRFNYYYFKRVVSEIV